jgi:predicted PurR-regulated permease PerM
LAATICAAVLALAGLWAASAVMTPVAFALFIIALVWPLQRRLQAVLPQVVAVLVTAAVALLAIGGGGWLVVWGFGGIAQWVIANAARLQGLYMHAADMLEQRGLYAAELFAEQVNVLWLVQVLRAIGGSLQGVLSFSIVTFVFVILGLLEVEPLGRRLRRMDDGQGGGTTIEAATEIAARLQTYMLVRFGMSVLTGLGFWVFTAVYGLELQREWGVLAFVLNFIPFIGSFVATLLPTLFAAAQFESLYAALVVFIGLNLLQFVIGSYLEPRVAGTAVSVSPFMVLVAVFFWGLLWGIAGAFIGVPIRRRQRLDRAGKIPPLDIEGGEQGGGAIALIIMCHGGAAPLLHRQSGLGAVKRLDLALLVDAEDQAWADGSM